MPTGALNPCPLRLGGDLTAEQTSRLTADVMSSLRTSPLGVMIVQNGIPIVYYGRNGNGVATFDSGATYMLGGTLPMSIVIRESYQPQPGFTITLGTSWTDEIGALWPVNIVGIDASPTATSTAISNISWTSNAFILASASHSGTYIVLFYTDDVARTIDQYGGDLDKQNSTTEGESPYAWGWLLEMRGARGSAYATDGLIDVENIAWARMFGYCQRIAEQSVAMTDPLNASGGRLAQWSEWLGLSVLSTDSEATTRAKAAARKRLKLGAVEYNLIPAIQSILGPDYVGIFRDVGTFTSPPNPTLWSEVAINPGTLTAFGLGTGGGTVANDETVWISRRFWPTIIVQVPANQTVQDVANLCQSQLVPLLGDFMPSVADVAWGRLDSNGTDSGFILGQSLMGFDLM